MRDDSYVVLNTTGCAAGVLLGIVGFASGMTAYKTGSPLEWIFFGCACLLFLGELLFSPVYCELSPEGIRIVYLFGFCESARWEEISAIEYRTDRKTAGRHQGIRRTVTFKTLNKNRNAFFMASSFPATKRLYDLLWYFAKDKMTEVHYKNGKPE